MAESILEKLQRLLEEGKKFNYDNFSTKGMYGYPETYTPEYISWRTRMQTILEKSFGKESAVFKNFLTGAKFPVLGNDRDQFRKSHAYFIGALQSAIDLLDLEKEVVEGKPEKKTQLSNKVFIVHGHDEKLKQEVEIFLKDIGLEPIVLHRQPDKGQTIIEKFESNSDVGYAIILLTPDDMGYPISEEAKEEKDKQKNFRARQNVIFEFGYFAGKLGRPRVCCLYKENVELPTDITGIVYKKVTKNIEEIAMSIIKDLKSVGYTIRI